MRRILVASAAVALVLTACSSGETDDSSVAETSPTSTEQVIPEVVIGTPGEDLPSVEGEFGEAPTLTFPSSDAPDDVTVAVIHEGDGPEVEFGSVLVSHYQVGLWGETTPAQSSYLIGTPNVFLLDRLISGWQYGLQGTQTGDRVVLSIPSDYAYPEGNPNLGTEPGDVLVFVVDIFDARQSDDFLGEAAEMTGELPEGVSLSGDPGSPAVPVIAQDAPEPTEISVHILAEGTGAPIAEDDYLVAAYGATTWSNAPYGSSWTTATWDGVADPYGVQAPIGVAVGAGTPFDDLVGLPLGSRVLLLLPANADSGTEPQAVVADIVSAH